MSRTMIWQVNHAAIDRNARVGFGEHIMCMRIRREFLRQVSGGTVSSGILPRVTQMSFCNSDNLQHT